MERADFYVDLGDEADWIGSVYKCGEVWALSTQILLQVNRIMYEEMVLEYIRLCEGVEASHICQWPWEYPDSKMTMYSYIFFPGFGKVYMSIQGGDLLDPIKILQGESQEDANVLLGPPIFPVMVELVSLDDEEIYAKEPTLSL